MRRNRSRAARARASCRSAARSRSSRPKTTPWLTAESAQVSRYRGRYGLVLATNLRDFVLLGEDAAGRPARLETFRLAGSAEEFWRRIGTPRAFARDVGAGLGEYLARALSHRAALAEPKDLAWLLALRRIAANLEGQGLGALAGARVKQAATERVFGFEIMPAPFVVAHLQVGLTMQDLDAPLTEDGTERAGVFLTNALTGWEPHTNKPLPFPELEEERDRADRVKQNRPILVILGNPPYNGFAGMAVDEERELSEAYRTTKRVRRPEGQGLNDLYVRFFRMAERRIAEKTGQGVVCLISNYSWLDGLSFTGMRERYLEAFDAVRIDCLNGDKYKTGKVAPDGSPDPSIFSTESDPVGIQVGTAIATLVRKAEHRPAEGVEFRHLWGQAKSVDLIATAEVEPKSLYEGIEPVLPLGLPFAQTAANDEWFDWPTLPALFPASFPGVKTSRDRFLLDVDVDRLRARIADYFDATLSHDDIARRFPGVMQTSGRYDASAVRDGLLNRGGPDEAGFVRCAYRPFDNRWLYWEKDTKLLDRKRADYQPHVFEGNLWIGSSKREIQAGFTQGTWVHVLANWKYGSWGVHLFPAWLLSDGLDSDGDGARRPNLSATAQRYLDRLGLVVEDLFHHALVTLHDPAYREANAGALRMDWPRIPLPGWPDGGADAADEVAWSAARGRELAALLDPDTPVPGVTQAPLRPEVAVIAVPATVGGRNMGSDDFAVTAGWGHYGQGDVVMPGQGCAVERAFSPGERAALGDVPSALGGKTFDIYLNGEAFWRNVPTVVWAYRLGGYQVLKKWLSRTPRSWPPAPPRGGPALHRHRAADRGDFIAGRGEDTGMNDNANSTCLTRYTLDVWIFFLKWVSDGTDLKTKPGSDGTCQYPLSVPAREKRTLMRIKTCHFQVLPRSSISIITSRAEAKDLRSRGF